MNIEDRRRLDRLVNLYQLMGEVLYVYFLIVHTNDSDEEQETINTVLGWARSPVAIPSDLVDSLVPGLIYPGPGFYSYRPFQAGFIIEFVEQWKEQSNECTDLLDNPWEFKNFLNNITPRSHCFPKAGNRYRMQRKPFSISSFPKPSSQHICRCQREDRWRFRGVRQRADE